MTSPSDRVSLRLPHDQAELLRALAYEFHNTPSSLAAIYVRKGMDEALRRGARLADLTPTQFRFEVLQSLQVGRALRLVPPEPTPVPEQVDG